MPSLSGLVAVLVAVFGLMPDESSGRYMSMSVNFTMAMSDERHGPLSLEIVHHCMRHSELSLRDFNRFRQSLQPENPVMNFDDPNIDNDDGDDDPSGDQQTYGVINGAETATDPALEDSTMDYELLTETDRGDEALHCFTHCLYEQLGVVGSDFIVDALLYRKLLSMLKHEKREVPECSHLSSANKCEATYKMHLCYNRLKFMEAESRIRRILETGDYKQGGGDAKGEGEDAKGGHDLDADDSMGIDGEADNLYEDAEADSGADGADADTVLDSDLTTNSIEAS